MIRAGAGKDTVGADRPGGDAGMLHRPAQRLGLAKPGGFFMDRRGAIITLHGTVAALRSGALWLTLTRTF